MQIKTLDFKDRPYSYLPRDPERILDYEKIPGTRYIPAYGLRKDSNKNKPSSNPVKSAGIALQLLAQYAQGNRTYNVLTPLKEIIYFSLYEAESKNYYFEYDFDFRLHERNEMMKAPWVSGMAQGMWLSVLSRVVKLKISPEIGYEKLRAIFDTFTISKEKKESRISFFDMHDDFWIDEYPFGEGNPDKCFVLNGHIFGIYGLYDYWLITQDHDAKIWLEAAIQTVYNNIHHFRNPGGCSFYCLKHKVITDKADAKYHRTHIGQLYALERITGEEKFLNMAKIFLKDYYISPVKINKW
jgi:hypothetical protein